MSIVAIDPATLRSQSNEKKKSTVSTTSFGEVLNTANPAITAAVSMNEGYQPAAVTNVAISGVANAPYYSRTPLQTNLTPFGSGVYKINGEPTGGGTPVGGFGTYPPYSNPMTPGFNPYANNNFGNVPGIGAPSQDYLEKQALFSQMNDANWEMLLAQVTVNEISRDYQARSNILKTKSDTELNAVRNMRA